jgi:hypothetical protein
MSGALTTARGPRKEPAPAWQLRLLGRPGLLAADGLRSIALRPKDAALLALVALAGPIQSDHVAALLWPTATGKQADTSLRQRLFRLRRETGMALVGSGATMTLEPGLGHDLAATLEQIAIDEHAGRAELLGDLDFDDLPDLAAWVGAERRKWSEQRDSALAAAAAACEQRRRLGHAAEQHARGPDRGDGEQGEAAVPDRARHVPRNIEEALAQRGAILGRIGSVTRCDDVASLLGTHPARHQAGAQRRRQQQQKLDAQDRHDRLVFVGGKHRGQPLLRLRAPLEKADRRVDRQQPDTEEEHELGLEERIGGVERLALLEVIDTQETDHEDDDREHPVHPVARLDAPGVGEGRCGAHRPPLQEHRGEDAEHCKEVEEGEQRADHGRQPGPGASKVVRVRCLASDEDVSFR